MLMLAFLFAVRIPGRTFSRVELRDRYGVECDTALCRRALFLVEIALKVDLAGTYLRYSDIIRVDPMSVLFRG